MTSPLSKAAWYRPSTDDAAIAAAYNDGYRDGYAGENRRDPTGNDESLWYEIGYNDGEDRSDEDHWSVDHD